MKRILTLLSIVLFSGFRLFAQTGINADGSPPNPSAGLDVKFNNKGLLLPRMTNAGINTIVNPAPGLMVICTDCAHDSGALAVFQNGSWRTINTICLVPGAPTAGTQIPSVNQIVWNWNTVPGATGYKWNTTNNYYTATEMGTATTKTETGLACNTPYTRYAWAYACGNSTALTMNQTSSACPWSCGSSITINHVAGNVAPVTKTVTYGTVSNIPGETTKCWITSNLGADHQATAVNDATEPSAGWYWQFNRKQGYKNDGTTVTPAWTITSINENSDWQLANDPCAIELGSGWRIPTSTEWTNVNNSFVPLNDWSGEWNSALKLHAAGYLNYSDGSLDYRGYYGYYCCSTQYNATGGWGLFFNSGGGYVTNYYKANGFSARCVRD